MNRTHNSNLKDCVLTYLNHAVRPLRGIARPQNNDDIPPCKSYRNTILTRVLTKRELDREPLCTKKIK